MTTNIAKVTEQVVSCSDNGQHPLVYINLKEGKGSCQYCSQVFELTEKDNSQELQAA
ncbi:MAG: zinc-finger domain-containing protein [Mariprofundaceae bacterium]